MCSVRFFLLSEKNKKWKCDPTTGYIRSKRILRKINQNEIGVSVYGLCVYVSMDAEPIGIWIGLFGILPEYLWFVFIN